jgi:hypothetical protein
VSFLHIPIYTCLCLGTHASLVQPQNQPLQTVLEYIR